VRFVSQVSGRGTPNTAAAVAVAVIGEIRSEVESYIHTHTNGMSESENERRNEFMTLYFLFNNYLNPFNFNIIIFYFNF